MSEELLNTWSVDFTPLDRWEFRQRSNRLEESLLSRLSLSVLSQRGILDASDLAASLHSAASNLNHRLAHRSSMADLQNKNILPLNDSTEPPHHVDQIYHTRKQSLQEAMENRPNISEIADLGYIDDSGMAPRLQPTALRLNRRLTERKSREDLVTAGIIQELVNEVIASNATEENPEREKKKKKKKKGKRNSRSEKHEKTPSILWRDVKKKKQKQKSKKITMNDNNKGEKGNNTVEYRVGDKVRLTKSRSGIIRYIGKPHFSKKDERIGIELDKWSAKGHDGRVGKFRYFSTKYGHGTFVTQAAIVEKLKSRSEDNNGNGSNQFQIGDYVLVKDDRKGVIRYIGSTGIVRGCLVGVELDEKSPAGHDGRFGGKNYFECPEGHGIFVRLIDVIKVLKTKKEMDAIETIPDDMEISEETISDALSIGDRVTLANNKQGIIKYIGSTDFSENKPMLGIELDDLDATAQDGSVGSKSYFKTAMGKGIFVRRASVVAVGNKEIAQFIKEQNEEKEEDQDESGEEDDEEDEEEEEINLEVGDYVETESAIKGIIKFIGDTDFAKGELIGLEMETWDADGHDGAKNNKRYFQCKQGHGFWTRKEKIKRYLKIPAHLRNVDIKKLLQDRDVKTGKRHNLVEEMEKLEEQRMSSQKDLLAGMTIEANATEKKFENAKVGDRVELERGRMGTIRYMGGVRFNSSEEVIGIELDKFDAQAHDGRGYFETKKGHGYAIFKTMDDIKRLIPMDKLSTPIEKQGSITPAENVLSINIDDRVRLKNGRTAVIRWKGIILEGDNEEPQMLERFGIELDISDSIANNGFYKETKYFNCAPNRGIFLTFDEIVENLGSTSLEWLHHKYTIINDQSVILRVNMRVQTLIGGAGIIRYLGNPGFVDDLLYGIELDQWSPNATNGFVNGEEFFQCEQGKAFFVGKESIIKCLTVEDSELMEPSAMDLPVLQAMPRMHDKIKLVDGQIGVISFIGMLEFSSETYIGIKLDQWSPNGNDGSAAGKKYFKCEGGHGYFVKLVDCAANVGSIIATSLKNTEKDQQKKTSNLLKVGDKVRLQDGGVGTVKFIGNTHFNENEMVGIELESWNANGHNGKVKGRTYFKASPGCGTFARRGSIAERLTADELGLITDNDDEDESKQPHVPLPDPGDRVKLLNGDEGIVQWVEDNSSLKDRRKQIQIQLVDSTVGGVSSISTITLNDILENLGPQPREDSEAVTDDKIKTGAHVRLTRGKTGYIRYIGPVGNVDELVGIELDSWTHNGHDGKGHYKCPIGRGYFTKRTNIIGVIQLSEKSTQEQLQMKRHRNIRKLRKKLRKILMLEQKAKNGLKLTDEHQQQLLNKIEFQRQLQELQQAFARNTPAIQIDDIVKHDIVSIQKIPEVAMFDTVILDTGERGRVVFIGDVHFDDHEMLGIVLNKWSPNAHNGSIDGKSYFVAPDGKGLLVPLSAVHDVHNANRQKSVDHDDIDDQIIGDSADNSLSNLKVGDEVQLGAKKGRVKFLGTTEFSKDEPVLGIELDDWSANANDGTIQGKKYFETSPGKGFFMRKQSYMNLADMINASEFASDNPENEILRRDSVVIHDISSILPIEYEIGDKVRLENDETGVIKYIGKTAFSQDKLIGLELDKWSPNGHSGIYKETPYFDAVDGRGFFVRHDLIISKVDPNHPMPFSSLHAKNVGIRPPNTRSGDRIRLKNGLVGIIRFQGRVDFSDDVYIGMELEKKHYNGNDGQAHGRRYFNVKKKRGYFAKKTEIARILTSSGAKSLKQMKNVKSLHDFPKLGDKVKTVKGKKGIVKYIGTTSFAKGILIGLELSQWWPNGHDGSVKKQRYFSCPMGRGYFTRLSHLIENFGAASNDNDNDVIADYQEEKVSHSGNTAEGDVSLPGFKVGDRVKLQHGKTGVVRFIGQPDFAEEEVVGIELDTWSANAGDGSVGGERVFATSAGRGFFTRRKSVANIIQSKITEGAYARLKGLLRVPKFNGKTVKIVAYVEKKGRWKVKLLHAKQEKKYLGVREENLDPILDWEPINDSDITKLQSLEEYPEKGERVKTRKGRYGTVKYIGNVEFSKGTHIGLELEQWDPNGHNGTVRDKMYYHTMDGRGYFVKLDNLVENLGRTKSEAELKREQQFEEENKPKAPLPEPPKVKQGDRVVLARGRTGVVKYIGATEFSDGKEVIGLELDTYDAGGSDKHKKYFNAAKGRGYFTRRTSVANIIPPNWNEDKENEKYDKTTKRLISRTRKKLREIEVLEFKHKSGVILHPNQIAKMNRKDELTAKLELLKKGGLNPQNTNKMSGNAATIREKVRILARKTSIDWTGKFADKVVIDVEVDDAVRVANGGTGVVQYVGAIDFLGDKNVIGILMDQWHPSYGNGTIDGKKYFDSNDGRGYFAHPPEIIENLGSTRPKQKAPMAPDRDSLPKVGDTIKLKDGNQGVVKFVGATDFSDGQKMVGVELDTWSTNTNTGTVNDKEYFASNPGRGYFARLQSISDADWKVPTDLVEEAKRLDDDEASDNEDPIDSAQTKDGTEISVTIGDRIVTVRGYCGVVRFTGGVHFDEREVIGIELDQWSPNGHNGIIHGHKYFSCTDGRGYFIRKNGIEKNMGPTRRRRKSRTQSMMDFGLITKNLKIGDHIKLARGKTGVVKYLGKSGDINPNDYKTEDIVGIELDEWSANGNDGKSLFKTSKGRGYFARRASIANIILPNWSFNDLEDDETQIELTNIKRQIAKIEKKLREIEVLEQKQKSGDTLDTQQLAKIDRKKHLKEKLGQLSQEMTRVNEQKTTTNTKTRRSLENEQSIKTFQKKRRGSINKEESLRNIQIGDRVRLVRGKTGIVKYLGPVDFTDEEVVGIILDKWHPNANNGLVKGKQYFKAPPGRGYFAKRALIIENLGSVSINGDLVHGDITSGAPMPKINFKIGDRVKLARGKTGVVKFIGETEFAKGEVIGLQLDTWTPAGHNGTVRNKKYFEAADGRGYFTRRSSISTVVIPLVKPLKQRRLSITYKLNPLQIGDRIRLTNDGKTGVIRYIGYPSFASGEVIGIELDDWSVNAHDGSANGMSVFDTSPGRGIFARRDEVEKYDPEKEKLEEIKKNLKLGDTVMLTGNRKGHVKYIGPVTGQDEMIGVELDSWSPDAKDGRFDGFRYFTAPDGRGVFIKRSAIVDVIPLENDPDIKQALSGSTDKKSRDRRESDDDIDDYEEKEYFVGDRVTIDGGNKGYLRYIGKDIKNEGVYGIELDLAVPKGTDGRHNNKRYFVCRNNHAVFVRKHTIVSVIDEDEIVAPQVGNRIKLTKGRFGIIHSIDEMDDGLLEYNINIDQLIDRTLTSKIDISHKRQHSSGGRRLSIGTNNYYNPKSGRQSGLLDIEDSAYKKLMNGTVDDDSDNYDSDDDNYTALGETIELRSGKIGTIRFIGPVHFAKGNWIGVELHDHFGPHDGAVRGVRYFTCPPKRGIFVKQIKGRKKDDPTRQHLKRRCPECYGEFIKKRDPRSAYKAVGIVCDGCSKHGNEFSSNDWYFQCGQCEQTDFCLKCMLKLPAVSSDDMLDSYQNVRAKFKPIGAEWIFEDIHNDEDDTENDLDTENERKLLEDMEEHKSSSKFLHAPIKSIFDHFDKNKNGRLTDSDINDLYKASKHELDKSLFINKTPMRYQQFEQCWKDIVPSAAQNILEYMSIHMKNQPKTGRESIEMLEKVRDIFEFFDLDMDGTLTLDDIESMIPLIDIDWNTSSKTKLLFDPPCDFIKFLAKIQSSTPTAANNILDKLLSFIHLKIKDVFNVFSNNNIMNESQIKLMYNYAYKQESDWRTTFTFPCSLSSFIENWSTMGIYEQRGIFEETANRINNRLQNIFDFFDADNNKALNNDQIQEILDLIHITNKTTSYKLFTNEALTFDKFRNGINLLHRSITSDILPALEDYLKEKNPSQFEESQEEVKQEISEQLRHEHFETTTNEQEQIINPLHRQHQPQIQVEEKKQQKPKPKQKQILRDFHNLHNIHGYDDNLSKRMQQRPSEKELWDRNILINNMERKEHRRRASQNLLQSLAQRPTFSDLVERGILMNENQQFNERIRQLYTLIQSINIDQAIKNKEYSIVNDIKDDYSSMTARLNSQIFEYKQTLHQFQDDVQSREQRLRQELEKKQRVLLHMNGMIEHQTKENQVIKNEYEDKIKEIKHEYEEKLEKNKILNEMRSSSGSNQNNHIQMRIKQSLDYLRSIGGQLHSELKQYHMNSGSSKQLQHLEQQKQQINNTIDNLYDFTSALASSSINSKTASSNNLMITQQYENKIKKQKEQIIKLKQQKKEMVKVVNDRMRDLKYMHQQELQKERQIANVLVENHKKRIDSLQERQSTPHNQSNNNNNNNYKLIEMQQQMEKLKKMYKQTLIQNDSLKKSKQKLENIVVKLSKNIVQTASKK